MVKFADIIDLSYLHHIFYYQNLLHPPYFFLYFKSIGPSLPVFFHRYPYYSNWVIQHILHYLFEIKFSNPLYLMVYPVKGLINSPCYCFNFFENSCRICLDTIVKISHYIDFLIGGQITFNLIKSLF